MTEWPMTIPYDLRCKLEELGAKRFTETDQDRWAVIKEWLEDHGVEAPDHALPMEPEIGSMGRH